MKVSEIEELVQQIADRICQQLPKPTLSLAFSQEKKEIPAELYTQFPTVQWRIDEDQESAGMIVKQLTISQMSSIALLQEKDLLTRRILSFLLQGKPILVLEILPAIPKETPLKYQVKKTIQEYRDKCQQFGLTFYRSPQDYVDFWKSCQKKSVPKALTKRTFITEKQLKKMLEYRIPLIKNAQLTPLAQDYMRTQKLLIKGEKACF
ncbi:ethanolamine utilization protein [Enterococcus sp. DIV0421]|uniref:ethanolamine utilization protein n=1 Tax=Enterococcus sp. DIV0421 TaxID=2774688 RepID=UPI003F242DEA